MTLRRPTSRDNQTSIRRAREILDRVLDLVGIAHVDRINVHAK
jgi:hypothetical protein